MSAAVQDLLLARRLVESDAARTVREARGVSRRMLAEGQSFTVAAIRKWETHERVPTGPKGAAYGAALRALLEVA